MAHSDPDRSKVSDIYRTGNRYNAERDIGAHTPLFVIDAQDEISQLASARDFHPQESILASLSADTRMLLHAALRKHRGLWPGNALTLLVPPRAPPETSIRKDDAITAFLASGPWASAILEWQSCSPLELCFRALASVLSGEHPSIALSIVDKATDTDGAVFRPNVSMDVLLSHRGSDQHLRVALSSLARQTYRCRTILCFDQAPEPELCRELALHDDLGLFEVVPSPAGPYVPRQHFSLTSTARYVAFQDTDDFSLPTRLETLVAFAELRDADIVGCHELRCDELTRTVEAIRLPLDVNRALEFAPAAAQVFSTTVARVDSLRRAGGFSTIRTFGADRQFQFRAHWSARMLNVDSFLYVRRLREGSLTTSAATGMNSQVRQETGRRWRDAFMAAKEGRIALSESALRVEHARNTFMIHDLRTGSVCPASLDSDLAAPR